MKSITPSPPGPDRSGQRLLSLVLLGGLLLALLAILRSGHPAPPPAAAVNSDPAMTLTHSGRGLGAAVREFKPTPARPAEEVVAEKLTMFARQREELVAAMAKQFNVAVPPDLTRFFAAVQAGNWPEITNLFASLQKLRESEHWPPGLEKFMPAIVETYGVAEQTHQWPAQQLLDYGYAVLDSLRPGMIYVGGTDAGRFIPTLLDATGEGERHIILTQNALADGEYLEYLRFQFGDQFNALTSADSERCFQTYLADAQKRLQHDRDFPNEPRQVRPGEDISVSDSGGLRVSGQVAVMGINELLLTTLLQKNPTAAFALEESFPLHSFYGEATTLGPIKELHATDPTAVLTAERAAQALDYWRSTTQTLLADTETASTPRDAYTKLILGQGSLFQEHHLSAEAEQAFQLATSLSPANPEAVFRYVNLLVRQNRFADARQVAQTAASAAPNNEQFRSLLTQLNSR